MSSSDPKIELTGRAPTRLANGLQPFETDASTTPGTSEDDDDDGENAGAAAGGTASIPNLVTSLVKSIIGSGVLALPAGMAAIGNVPAQVLPATYALILMTATLNAGFFTVIGTLCGATSSTTFQQCWDRSVGPEHSAVVSTVITLKTFLSCLAFSIILADSMSSLLDLPRTVVLWSITVTAILPLTLLKDIKSLAPFSALGLAGMGVTSAAMLARWLDGTYGVNPAGPFVQSLAESLRPEFGAAVAGSNYLHGVVLACSLTTAFMAHYNAPRFHAELANNSAQRFQTVTFVSYAVSAVLFGLVATAGYMTFGGNSQGFILNNYASSDPLILVSRFALSLSILLTYPLPFVGLRDGCLDLLRTVGLQPSAGHQPQALPTEDSDVDEVAAVPSLPNADKASFVSLDTVVTLGLLFLVTVAATFCRDLGLVVSVGGGTFSTAVASVFPTLMLTSLYKKQQGTRGGGGDDDLVGSTEVTIAWIGMAVSVAIGMAGVGLALSNAFG
jgi:amino acid permease